VVRCPTVNVPGPRGSETPGHLTATHWPKACQGEQGVCLEYCRWHVNLRTGPGSRAETGEARTCHATEAERRIEIQKNRPGNTRDRLLSMVGVIKVSYLTQRLVRLTVGASLLLGSLFFFRLTGGFPPLGWRVLAQALANLPELWALRGPAVLLPLFVVCAHSLALLLIWTALIGALLWATVQQRNYLQTWRRIEQTAREVQHDAWMDAREGPHPASALSPVPTTHYRGNECGHRRDGRCGEEEWGPSRASVVPCTGDATAIACASASSARYSQKADS
jgi:hypothetical protein